MSREQELVDILFECVATATDPQYIDAFQKLSFEAKMKWVSKQLKLCGFRTRPCGASWGVLSSEK
jgi:hypothetical protein